MARKKKIETPTPEAAPAAAPQEATAKRKRVAKSNTEETRVAAVSEPDKPTRRKRTAAPPVATDAPAPDKPARRKREKVPAAVETASVTPEAPKPDLVVFAFRLTQAERDAIHQTAGPRNATQFVRRVAVAFAQEDKTAFETVLKEARTLRS